MAFDNTYPNRKDWRRPLRGSKATCRSCRNGGSCVWCARGRAHKNARRAPVVEKGGAA